ncbi:MAG: hypothetical protein PUC47_07210, partial [Oscillospiraceae bacterium]|nr:hypothetical protein [Oscillospiraceae bacterium]
MEGGRDAQGRLSHVIFATQSIQEMKVRELEAQQKLQETNEELTALLAEEKRHTSIIDALRNVFFALYYLDLEENTLQEIITQDSAFRLCGDVGDARSVL